MATERLVTCPHCQHQRPTRAAGGMRLKCPSCGEAYRAPAPTAADELPVAEVATAPPAAAPASTSPTSSGITVVEASGTSVATAPAPAKAPAPAASDPDRVKTKAAVGGRQRAKSFGRFGGRR